MTAPGETGSCRSCGSPILWRRTVSGKAIPIDPDPHLDGNVDLDRDGRRAHVLSDAQPTLDARPLHRAHFVTCPCAALHRRPR